MKIICVDDDLFGRMRLKRRVKAIMPDAEIYSCKSQKAAMQRAAAEGCDVLLTEIKFGERQYTGVDLAEEIKKGPPCQHYLRYVLPGKRICLPFV